MANNEKRPACIIEFQTPNVVYAVEGNDATLSDHFPSSGWSVPGDGLVKLARLFGINVDENDIVGTDYIYPKGEKKKINVMAADIELQLHPLHPRIQTCTEMWGRVDAPGLLTVWMTFDKHGLDVFEYTYSGNFVVLWDDPEPPQGDETDDE